MIEQRQKIEMELIGLALEGQFVNLTGLLKAKHFTKSLEVNHQRIWQTFEELYPKSSINLITVTNHLRKKFNISYAVHLSNCLGSVVSNNPFEMSLMLLEFNFRQALIEMFENELKTNPEERDIILEILQEIKHLSNDIVDLLNDITAFAMEANLYFYDNLNQMNKRVNRIAEDIKECSHIRSLVTHLKQVKGLPLDAKRVLAIKELTELLVLTLGSREIPENLNETLKRIRYEYFK